MTSRVTDVVGRGPGGQTGGVVEEHFVRADLNEKGRQQRQDRARVGNLAYIASKGGVSMITKAAALDYADKAIRVNAILPGTIETPILATMTPQMREGALALHPMGRFGQPAEVASLALFLASEESSWVTGSEYLIDGGRLAQ